MGKIKQKYKGRNLKESEWVKRFWKTYAFSFIGIILFFFMLSMGWLGFMPSFEELENPSNSLAAQVISADQVELGSFYIENRTNVHYEDLSPWLVKALVATEDARFEKHSGIDVQALARAVFGVAISTNKGGGSTITQQLAKNLFPRDEHYTRFGTAFAKLKEWITAVKLERNYTKQEIIALYLNTVDFGSLAFGVKSAAKTYFNKTPKELNVQEAATLIGLLKAPSYFHPVRNKDRSLKRREVVLNQMRKSDFITEKEYDSLRKLPLDLSHYSVQDHTSGLATYFREYLRLTLNAEKPIKANYIDPDDYIVDSIRWERDPAFGWRVKNKKPDGSYYNLYKDGLKIYTTVNSKMQQYAEQSIAEHMGKDIQPAFFKHWKGAKNAPYDLKDVKEIQKMLLSSKKRSDRYKSMKKAGATNDEIEKAFNTPIPMRVFSWNGAVDTMMSPMDSIKYHKWFLQAGLMSIEPQTGYVRAYVGGINFKYFKYDHVVIARRQVGSTFKPVVYTTAMQDGGMTPCTSLLNVQPSVQSGGTVWAPRNASHYKEGQMITLKDALANSVNWISAQLIIKFSPGAVVKIARKLGIISPIPSVYSICLGTPDLSLCEMTAAMSTFVNQGMYIQPIFVTRIEDKHGNVIANFSQHVDEAVSERTAAMMVGLMKGVVETGTGMRLRGKYGLRNPIAGKTGTTQSNSDGWFMGLTPELVTGVWVGGDDRTIRFRSMSLGQGANTALPIFGIYMQKIYADPNLKVSQGDFELPQGMNADFMNCWSGEGDMSSEALDDKNKF